MTAIQTRKARIRQASVSCPHDRRPEGHIAIDLIKRVAALLVASCLLLLTGCGQEPSLALKLPDGAQRDTLALTMDEFINTFTDKAKEAGVQGRAIGELKKSPAGIYDRYTYHFDDHNRIVLDCPGGQETLSALYLVNTLPAQESGTTDTAVAALGASISIMIYAATGQTAEEIQELLDALGVTAAQTPDTGAPRGARKNDIFYQIHVEKDSIIFAIAALSS